MLIYENSMPTSFDTFYVSICLIILYELQGKGLVAYRFSVLQGWWKFSEKPPLQPLPMVPKVLEEYFTEIYYN